MIYTRSCALQADGNPREHVCGRADPPRVHRGGHIHGDGDPAHGHVHDRRAEGAAAFPGVYPGHGVPYWEARYACGILFALFLA